MSKKKTTLDRTTPKRTMPNVKAVIDKRLKELHCSRLWLAEQIGVRPATVYDFFGGGDMKVTTLERIMAVLGMEISVSGYRAGYQDGAPSRKQRPGKRKQT